MLITCVDMQQFILAKTSRDRIIYAVTIQSGQIFGSVVGVAGNNLPEDAQKTFDDMPLSAIKQLPQAKILRAQDLAGFLLWSEAATAGGERGFGRGSAIQRIVTTAVHIINRHNGFGGNANVTLQDIGNKPIRDIMTPSVFTVTPSGKLMDLTRVFNDLKFDELCKITNYEEQIPFFAECASIEDARRSIDFCLHF